MAIKPDDCVVKITDLVVGEKEYLDYDGRKRMTARYEKYWENFCEHTDKLKNKVDWSTIRTFNKDVYAEIEDNELAKYGAKMKRTKEYKGNYIKFKSHKHLTMFIMKWS